MFSVPENRFLQHGFTFQNRWDQGAHDTKARPPLWLRADDLSLPRALVTRFQATIVGRLSDFCKKKITLRKVTPDIFGEETGPGNENL